MPDSLLFPYHCPHPLPQPASPAEERLALELLASEVQQHSDIVIVPGGLGKMQCDVRCRSSILFCCAAETHGLADSAPFAESYTALRPCTMPYVWCIIPHLPPSPAGADTYRSLPSKTLQLLHYALSSSCRYTHIAKVDDDVHLRPQVRTLACMQAGRHARRRQAGGGCAKQLGDAAARPCMRHRVTALPPLPSLPPQLLMDIIQTGRYNFSVEVQHDGSGEGWWPAPARQAGRHVPDAAVLCWPLVSPGRVAT